MVEFSSPKRATKVQILVGPQMEKQNNNTDPFVEYLLRPDETGVVLKCHLELERNVDNLLVSYFPNSIIVIKWSFADKVDVLFTSGVIAKDIWNKLKTINKIRNKFSHQYGYKLSSSDLTFLINLRPNKKEVEIPEKFKNYPKMKEILLMTLGVTYLGTHLDIVSTIAKKDKALVGNFTKIMENKKRAH